MNSLFAYSDYRLYLQDWYAEKKQANTHFSFRLWAEKSGFKARDYLMRVMRGDRNLSLDGIEKLSEYFHFSEKQIEYFRALVAFNQAEEPIAKEKAWQKLSQISKIGVHQKIRREQFEYFSSWHYAALRSLLPVTDCGDDWEKVGRWFDPILSAKQVKDSVDLLLKLGLLQRKAKGRYTVTHAALTTGDEIASVAVAAFHKTTIDLVKRSIEKHPSTARDISGITMSLSNQGYQRIKTELSAFRKKVMEIAAADTKEDMVYQLNLHLIPLTQNRGVA